MSDFNNNYSNDSIEDTRRKKIDEFKRGFNKNVLSDDSSSVRQYGDDDSYVGFSSSSSQLRRRRKSNEINSYSDSDTKKRIERESKKALKQQSKEDKRIEKNKAKRNQKMFKWVWLTMVVIIGIVLSQVILVGVNDLLAIEREKDPKTVVVSIPADPTMEQIGQILEDAGVIDRADFFVLYADITSSVDGFRQGEFEIETDKDYEAIINFLQSNVNRTDIVTVQLTEGMNVIEIANKLHEEGVVEDVQAFLDVCNSDDFDESYTFLEEIDNEKERYYKLEGYLFPDTYDFYLNEDPETVVSKMLNNFENKMYGTKSKYLGASKSTTLDKLVEKSDYSMDEIITIASIIQAEAANEEDMYNVSSVLHNRLEYGVEMGVSQLNCDCTVYYPYREYKDVPETIRDTYESSYNTNNFSGLPAGPICNPSLDAILAALGPNDTSYYFFCHDTVENGSTAYYATTNAEHEYNLTLIG
ncbi:MAG: endolytic transglycosylase MltG [Ruminococcaceae bacterium]|nr:endolytic transglycosylase MltG [Oscillospiraceae bacterium]